jgi:hypothetical protein
MPAGAGYGIDIQQGTPFIRCRPMLLSGASPHHRQIVFDHRTVAPQYLHQGVDVCATINRSPIKQWYKSPMCLDLKTSYHLSTHALPSSNFRKIPFEFQPFLTV